MNREYLDKQAAKAEEERLAAERAGEEGEEGADPRPARPKKRSRKGDPRASVEEAVEEELRRNRVSSRINYDLSLIHI
eukprot:3657501-Prymnesium_polylepis.1